MPLSNLLWTPSQQRVKQANITRFAQEIEVQWSMTCPDYDSLWRWSVREPNQFWQSICEFCEVLFQGETGSALIAGKTMRDAVWFPNLTLNYAENLLRARGNDALMVVFRGEDKLERSFTYRQLYDQVSVLAQALRDQGVRAGDRVAGILPNMPEAIIAMLAATSIGAIWSSCSPDFGVNGVMDRFGQIEPKVLFVVDYYYYNGKRHNLVNTNRELSKRLSSVEIVVVCAYDGQSTPQGTAFAKAISWKDYSASYVPRAIEFAALSFDHPLFIMFSSGTTGVPKCIVHCHGGTLLQHMKEHQLHVDVHPGDRLFYFTTCGWMMWNWLVSGLASKAVVMLYDGSPFYPDGNVLFDYIDDHRITQFGTSAKFIDASHKANIKPCTSHQLTSVKTIVSTGSVLVPESFDYVYRDIKTDVCLASVSGGTDIIACFVSGSPTLPVYCGELQCRALGMDVDVFDDDGNSITNQKGELVCKSPFPSLPIGFWNDADGEKYRQIYFDRYPDIWCQGDYVELTNRGTMIFYGRSDAVLNPGGVRIGTAEIYRQVETLEEIVESLVIGQNWQNDVRIVLFVKLRDGIILDDALVEKIKRHIRNNTTPRHVPAKIVAVADIPRTKSGKIVELAVRKIVHNEAVKNVEALANPEALELFKDVEELNC